MAHNAVVLVHYHEVGLKGHNRYLFERKLRQNIEAALSLRNISAKVSKISGRELIEAGTLDNATAIADIVKSVPGVARVSAGLRVQRDMDIMCATALDIISTCEPYSTFKVNARRANTDFPIDSMQMNRDIGAYLCENTDDKKVRLKGPDAEVHVEVIEGSAYIYAYTRRGVGGLPVGSGGRVVCLLSGGIDSPVAAWRMLRRGAEVIGLHFSGAPETPDTSEYLVKDITRVLESAGGLRSLHVVRFGSYQRKIALCVPEKLRVIMYRRLMIAVANAVAKKEKAKAIVTGESLGQVASQTLDNICATDAVATWPVLRPLIGMDKVEIIDDAKKLGTYDISIQDHDDCCTLFMPRAPETHAKIREVNEAWESMPTNEWIDEIVDLLYTVHVA
ncbi:MAG: tRNA 4-thiouridine(8) synthase ThiI [Coriobacteriales bacterium]|nr:tRNA 4-thiouridine(8) synthase ThiI [Coriobacteriales bacterium]